MDVQTDTELNGHNADNRNIGIDVCNPLSSNYTYDTAAAFLLAGPRYQEEWRRTEILCSGKKRSIWIKMHAVTMNGRRQPADYNTVQYAAEGWARDVWTVNVSFIYYLIWSVVQHFVSTIWRVHILLYYTFVSFHSHYNKSCVGLTVIVVLILCVYYTQNSER